MTVRPYQIAFLCAAAGLLWQWGVVYSLFNGDWNGLYVTSGRFRLAPAVQSEHPYVFPSSFGYDGQFYHAIAHDPLNRDRTAPYIDNPPLRYSRILIPALSFAMALGQSRWVDPAYRTLILASLWLGVFVCSRFAEEHGRSVWWGAAFLGLPAAFISLERQLTDLTLCALVAAAIYLAQRERWGVCWLALAAAALTRETGLVAVAAFAGSALLARSWRRAAVLSLAALPALGWFTYILLFMERKESLALRYEYPFSWMLRAIAHPQPYPAFQTFLHVLDAVAIAGMLLAFWLGLRALGRDPLAMVAAMFVVFGIAASGTRMVDYTDPYSYARVNSPLLLALLLISVRRRWFQGLSPFALILPRTLVLISALTFRSIVR